MSDRGEDAIYTKREVGRAKIVISCVGLLVEPNVLDTIPGYGLFKGDLLHSTKWPQSLNLSNKNVVVIGSGCTAAQIVPTILQAPYNAQSVTQIMRTPPWMEPKLEEPGGKEAYARIAPKLYYYFPALGYLSRCLFFIIMELTWWAAFQQKNVKWRAKAEEKSLLHMRSRVPEKYHEIMTPKYHYGCKRRVFDNEWLESMKSEKFHLINEPIQSIESGGVILATPKGVKRIRADTILANGFVTSQWIHLPRIHGRNGKTIQDVWQERGGPQAYMGTAMDGFPNLFFVNGPNRSTTHSSVIVENENIVNYILKIIKPVLLGEVEAVEPKRAAELRWTQEIQRDIQKTVFTGCTSWYHDGRWNSVLYP